MTPYQPAPVPAHWPSEAELIQALQATFPGLRVRPASDYGVAAYTHGAWLAGEPLMPDGLPIFCTLCCSDPEHYDGHVHHGFIAWLAARGWLVEEVDAQVFIVSSQTQAADDLAADVQLQDLIDQHTSLLVVAESLAMQIDLERARRADRLGEPEIAAKFRRSAADSRRQVTMLRSVRMDDVQIAAKAAEQRQYVLPACSPQVR